MTNINVRKLVFQSLKSSVENGYDDLFNEPIAAIANDLIMYDADLEGIPPENCEPHIIDWLNRNGYEVNLGN